MPPKKDAVDVEFELEDDKTPDTMGPGSVPKKEPKLEREPERELKPQSKLLLPPREGNASFVEKFSGSSLIRCDGNAIDVKQEPVGDDYKIVHEEASMLDMIGVKQELGNEYDDSIDIKDELIDEKPEVSDTKDRRGERRGRSCSPSPVANKRRPEVGDKDVGEHNKLVGVLNKGITIGDSDSVEPLNVDVDWPDYRIKPTREEVSSGTEALLKDLEASKPFPSSPSPKRDVASTSCSTDPHHVGSKRQSLTSSELNEEITPRCPKFQNNVFRIFDLPLNAVSLGLHQVEEAHNKPDSRKKRSGMQTRRVILMGGNS